MNLPEEFETILADLLRKSSDPKHVASVTSKATKIALADFPERMGAQELLDALHDADPDGADAWAELDPIRVADRLIANCDEFAVFADDPNTGKDYSQLIRFVWKRNTTVKNDRAILGTCAVVSQADGDLWPVGAGPCPWWTITLSLQAWLALSEIDRVRTVHHELAHLGLTSDSQGHPKACINAHDIEENLSTIARFGLRDKDQAKIVAAATAHPTTPVRMREWYVDASTGQGALWPPPISQSVVSAAH